MNDRHKMMYSKEHMQMTPAYKAYGAQGKTMMASYPPVQQPAQPPSHMMSSGMMTSSSVQRHGMTSHAMPTHGLPGQHVTSMPAQEAYVLPGYKSIPASPSAQPHSQAPVQPMYCVEQTGSIQSGKPPQRAPSYSQESVPPHSARGGHQSYGSSMLPPSSSIRTGGGAAPSGSIRTGTVGQVPSAGYLRPGVIPENTVNSGIKVRPTYYVPPGSHASHPVVVPHSPSSLPPAAPQPPKTAPVPSPGGGSMPPQQQRRYPPQPAPQPQAQPPMQPHQQPPSPRVMSSGAAPLPPQEGFGSAPRSKPPPPAGVVNGALDLTCMTDTPGPPPPAAKSGDAPLDLSVKVKKRPAPEPGEIERLSPPIKKPRSQFPPSQFAPPSSPVLDLRSPEPPLVPRGQVGMHAASPQAAGSMHRARNAYDSSPHPGDLGRRGSVGSVGSAGSSPSPTVKMTPPEMKHGVPPGLTPQQPPQLIKASPGMYLGYPGAAPPDRKPAVNPQQPQQQQQSPQSSLYPPHSPRHSSYSPLASPGAQSTHAQFKAGMPHPGSRGGTSPRSTSGGVVRGGEREVVVQRNGFPGYLEQQSSASGVIRSSQDVMGPPSSPQVSAMKSESAQMRMVQQQHSQHPQHQQRLPHQQDPIHHHHHQQQQHQQQQQAQQHHHHAQPQQQQQLPHHPQQYSHDVHYQRQMQQHHQQQQQQQHQHQQQQHHQQAQHQQQEEIQKAKTYGAAEAPHSRGYPGHPHAYQHPSPTSPSVAGYPGKGVPSGAMGHPHVPASSPHHLSTMSPHHLSPSMRDPSLGGLPPSSQQRQQASSAQGMSRPHAMPAAQSVPAPQQRPAGGAPVSMQGQPVPRSAPGQGQPHPSYSSSARVPPHAGSGAMYREEPGMARVGSSVPGHHPRSAEQSPSTQMYPGMYPSRSHLSPGSNSAGVSPQLPGQQSMVHGASQSQPHPKSSPGGQGLPGGSGHLPISQHPPPAVGRSSSAERGAVPVSVNGPASGGMSGHPPPSSGSVAGYHVPPGGAPGLHPSASGIGAFQSPANGLPSQMYQTGLAAPMGQPHVPGATSQTLPPRQASYDRQATGYDRQQAMRSPSTTRAPSSSAGGFRPAASYSHPTPSHAAATSSMVSQERSLCQVAEMHSNMAAASGARMRTDLLEHSVHAQRPKPPSDSGVAALTSTNVVSVTSVTVTSSQALSSLSAPRTTVTQALTSSVMSSTASPSSVVSAGSVTSLSPALKAEEVGVAGPRPKVDPAKLSQLSQPLEIAIPGASGTSSSGGSSSSRPATDLPPPTGTAPKCVVKQPQPVAGPSSSSSTSSSPKPMSRKHRLMTAFNKDEDLRRMQPPANPPDPSKASTSSSGDFKAPTVSPSSPPSPKMPILSPQQAPGPQTSPMHNEPPTLDPPATSEKRALLPVVKDRHGMFPHASGMDKARGALQPKPASSAAFRGMAKPAVPSSVLTAGPPPKSQVRTSVVMSVSSTLEVGLTSSPIVADSAVVASASESTPGSVSSAPVGPAPQPSEAQCADKGRSSTDAPSSSSSSASFSSGGAPVGPVDTPVSKDDMSCNAGGDGGSSGSGGSSVFSTRRNSLTEHWTYVKNMKNIPVANVAPFQHAKASRDGRELVVPPDEDCQTLDPGIGLQVGRPADVKLELEEEEEKKEEEDDEKDVPSPTGNQSRRQSPRKVPLMRNLLRSKRYRPPPIKLHLQRSSQAQDYHDMDDAIAADKASAAGRRKKQQQRRQQQQQRQQRRRRRQQQQQQQQQQEKSDGSKGKRSLLDDLSWPASKKSRDPGDLLLDDPALLGREERALRRAIIEIDKMESKSDPRDTRVATRRTTVSNANRKAQELKKRALGDRRRARDLSRRPLRSCTLRQRRFSDFEPTPLQRRPRRRRCQTRYNRNAAYEKELKREESRKALKRRQRERMRAGQTAHSDSDDTTDGEREEEGEEDEDEDLERVSARLPFQDVAEDSNSVPAPPELRKLAVNKNSGETILHKATKPGYEEVALYCLRTRSVEVNARDNAGYTPLHECCVRGNLTVAWYLILHGADVNCCSQDGIRPVHDAVENEHVEIVRLLLSCGADPSIATYAGKTPLKIARSQVMRDLIRGYLADLNGWECEGEEEQEEEEEEEVPWLFQGSSDFMDPAECSGFDVFADIPSDPEDEPEEMFDDDLTAAVPTYDLQVAGSSEADRFVLVEEAARELGVREEEVMRLCGRDGPCLRREEFLQLTSHSVLRPRQPKTERVRLLRLSTLKQHAESLSALAGKQGNASSSGAAPASGKHSPARQGYAVTKANSVGTPNKALPNARHTPNARQAGDEQGSTPGLTSSASYPPGPGHRGAYGKTRVMGGANGQPPLHFGCGPLGKTSPGSAGPNSQMFKPIKESPKKQAGPMGPYLQGVRKNFRDDLSVSLQKLNTTKVPQPRRPQASAPSGRPTWTTASPTTSSLPMSSSSLTSTSFSKSSPLSSSRAASLPSSSAATMQSAFSTSSSAMASQRMTMSLGGKQQGGAHVGAALTPGMKSHSYPLQGRAATAGSGAKGPLTLLSGKPTISTSRTAMTTFGQPSVVLSNSLISGEGRSAFVSRQGMGTGRPLGLGPGGARQEVGQDPRGVRERGASGEGQAKEDVYKFKVGTVPEDCFDLTSMKVLNGGSHALKAPGNQP